MGEVTASHLSFYTSFADIAAAALGGSGDDKAGPVTEDLRGVSPEHFQSRVASLLSA